MPTILLVDDDQELSELLCEYLSLEGFEVVPVYAGDQGLRLALAQSYDLIVLDVMLPGMNGFDFLKALRAERKTPVLMMTARGEEIDRVVGLEIGADDYLPKPCSPRELLARIRAILRRTQPEEHTQAGIPGEPLQAIDLLLFPRSRSVTLGGEPIELTYTEFDLLQALMESVGELVSRERLSRQVLKRALGPFDRSLDMHLSNLRRKLGPYADGSPRIRTVRGVGYQLLVSDAGPSHA